jgi:hypothetical protein
MLPATAQGIIALLCQPGMESAWRSERRRTSTFHAGFAIGGGDGYDFIAKLPGSWQVIPEWGDWPYLIGWHHQQERAVLIYCEGDLSVEVADDERAYLDLLERTTHELAEDPDDRARLLRSLPLAVSSSKDQRP